MKCFNCGCEAFTAMSINRTYEVEGKLYMVEDVPAEVCDRCGEPLFEAEVVERIRKMIHEPHTPVRTIETEVLRYDAA